MAKPKFRTCEVPGCNNKHYGRGMCSAHYRRMERHGDVGPASVNIKHGWTGNEPKCTQVGCGLYAKKDGYCNPHHKAMLNKRPDRTCHIVGCHNPYWSTGVCKKHISTLYKFNISVIQYNELLANGSCEICGVHERLVIDHDHNCCPVDANYSSAKLCGKCMRGILCNNCNIALGHAKESVDVLEKMIGYLRG